MHAIHFNHDSIATTSFYAISLKVLENARGMIEVTLQPPSMATLAISPISPVSPPPYTRSQCLSMKTFANSTVMWMLFASGCCDILDVVALSMAAKDAHFEFLHITGVEEV